MSTVSVQFVDRRTEFIAKTAVFSDALMGLMATGIQARIITSGKVPFLPKSTKWAQRGALRQSIRSQKLAVGSYIVTAGVGSPASAYAAAQEAGQTRGHPIRNYSTPGTGAHWFEEAIDTVILNADQYIEAAKSAAGLDEII